MTEREKFILDTEGVLEDTKMFTVIGPMAGAPENVVEGAKYSLSIFENVLERVNNDENLVDVIKGTISDLESGFHSELGELITPTLHSFKYALYRAENEGTQLLSPTDYAESQGWDLDA